MALGYICGKFSYFDDDQRQGLNKVDAHIRRQYGMMHLATGDDDARGDNRVGGVTQTIAAGMDELRRRQVAGQRINRNSRPWTPRNRRPIA